MMYHSILPLLDILQLEKTFGGTELEDGVK